MYIDIYIDEKTKSVRLLYINEITINPDFLIDYLQDRSIVQSPILLFVEICKNIYNARNGVFSASFRTKYKNLIPTCTLASVCLGNQS